MQTKVTFRHFKAQQPELNAEAIEAAENFEKYFDGIISVEVIFTNEALKTVEFCVHIKGDTLIAKDGSEDFRKSMNTAADAIVSQLKKWKTKHFAA